MVAGDAGATVDISVIVPVYNGDADLVACLAALGVSATPPGVSWELIVVDDGSTDGSGERARAAGARVVASPHAQGGPAAARNAGARAARGEVLLFIDADVAVPPDLIGRVAAAFRDEPGLDALFGSYDTRPAATNFVSQYKNLFHHYVHQISRERATTFWAGCGAIRRSVFLAHGGFDTSFARPSIEDIELGYRLTRAGRAIRLRRDLQVTHLKRWTPLSLLRTDIRDRGIPWTRLILRERAFDADLNLQTANRLSVVCVYLLAGTLLGAVVLPVLLVGSTALAIALIVLNWPVYRFFWQQRGPRFALLVLPWHWLYYGYSGLCVGLGLLTYLRDDWMRGAGREAGRVPGE